MSYLKRIATTAILAACAFVALLLVAGGCPRPVAPPAIEVAVVFDVTHKEGDKLARRASQMVNYVKKGDDFTLRATDHKVSLISTVRPKMDMDAYHLLKGIKVIPVTDLVSTFETMASVAETPGKPLVIVIYTDGLDDGTNPDKVAARIGALAQRLRDAPRLRALIIAGTERDVRRKWSGLPEMLAPVQSKLTLIPTANFDTDGVKRQVDSVRLNAAAAATAMKKGNN